MPAAIFIALLDLGKKSSFVDRHKIFVHLFYQKRGKIGDEKWASGQTRGR
jgi:hypothetical protein